MQVRGHQEGGGGWAGLGPKKKIPNGPIAFPHDGYFGLGGGGGGLGGPGGVTPLLLRLPAGVPLACRSGVCQPPHALHNTVPPFAGSEAQVGSSG